MMRRLVTILLAIALLPMALNGDIAGSASSRQHGASAARAVSHGPVAALTRLSGHRTASRSAGQRTVAFVPRGARNLHLINRRLAHLRGDHDADGPDAASFQLRI